jgi:DNA-binding transcriptional LysR family regulator
MDRLRSMEAFVAVVDSGSFTAAARTLGMSTVMVSKHVAELEGRLGARLLNRSTRRLSLTEIGGQYHEQCHQILEMVKLADSGAEAMGAQVRGTLKVSAPAAFGSECLAPALADYLDRYPDVTIDLDLSSRIVDIVEEGLDAAFRIGPLADSSMVARPLKPFGMAICAAPDYLRRCGTPLRPADLARHQCLDFLHWQHHVRWRLGDADAPAALPSSRLRSNNGHALKQAAVAGLGIVMQAEILLAEDIACGRLVPILKEYWPAPRPMHLIYPRDKLSTTKVASFVEFVVERFRLV